MDQVLEALMTVVVGVIGALGLLVIAMVPRIWQYMAESIHGKHVLLLRQTIENAAALAVSRMRNNEIPGVDAAIVWMVHYVRDVSMPDTVKKMKVSDDTIRTMCESAFFRVNNAVPRE